MKLSVKITMSVTLLSIIICTALTFTSYILSSKTMMTEVEGNMLKFSEEASKRVNLVINSNLKILEELAERARTKTMDWEIQRESLFPDVKRLGYLDMAIVNKEGKAKYVLNNNEANLGDRDYIKKAFAGESNVSNVIVSRVTNSVVVMYAVPIKINNKVEAVLIARADGTYFNSITDNLVFGKKGYSFILGGDSTMYAHPNREFVMEQINIYNEMDKNNETYVNVGKAIKKIGLKNKAVLDYFFLGSTRIMASYPIENTDWTLFVGSHKNEILKGIYRLRNISIIISLIFSLISFSIAVFLSMTITKPIKNISEKLNESASQIKSAAGELSHASQEMADASTKQAANIEETSTTLDETSAMVQQNTDNTKEAKMFAHKTKQSAIKGNEEMLEMTKAMKEIKNSSGEISKIIKVIENIAFQTNILALNAAVEAARAGEAGMGFAVVAEEVRNLAQRSSEAAKETADMIKSSIIRTDNGVNISEKVLISLKDINNDAGKLDELMEEILTASQEQTQGIVQVNKALNQMGQIVQETAANSEESAAAAEELDAQSESMNDIVKELVEMIDGNKV